MSTDCILISCTECDYNTKWKCNMTRHMLRKHSQQNVTLPQQNVTLPQQNVTLDNNENTTLFECNLCNKNFNKQWILNRHIKKCTGITNPLMCIHCNKIFANRHSKSRHIKTCNDTPIQNITNNINNITNNNNTTNNNINNTLNNTNNNITNNINIITYDPLYTQLLPIDSKHIDKIKRLINHRVCKNSKQIMDIIRQYVDYSLNVYQNRFVIKNNLRSSYSKVHCGNNNWKHFMDSVILPKFTNSIIGSFHELIPDVCDKNKYKFMYDYVDEMYSYGDLKHNTDACKDYSNLLDDIRLKLYDLTKDMKNFNQDYNNSLV